ncbi:MAG TPA: ribosomal protein S18-alanine N-acetyltransferase [Actinomycetaceae bacterium]|nr:ribosomal protein S18-alanine N-acetyltransferase [Actinomycetaceae bacterium]
MPPTDRPDAEQPSAEATLRPLTPADIPRVLELERKLFAPDNWSEGIYRQELTHPDRVYRAIEDGGVLIAWGGVFCAPTAEILTLGVSPEHRRRGHASRILRELLRCAAACGAREVFLEVRADDAGAQALYLKYGFEPVGVRRRYYPMSGADALVMRKSLLGP